MDVFFGQTVLPPPKMVIRVFSAFFQHFIEKIRVLYGQIQAFDQKKVAVRGSRLVYNFKRQSNRKRIFLQNSITSTLQ